MTKKHILVVDDDIICLKLVATKLLTPDYEIIEATSARQAIHYIENTQFDLIICDVSLPDISGISLAATVKKMKEKEIPFIFISSYPIHEMHIQDAQLVKDHNFFQKPLNFLLLLEKVNSLVSS